jgi:hypothetical protein
LYGIVINPNPNPNPNPKYTNAGSADDEDVAGGLRFASKVAKYGVLGDEAAKRVDFLIIEATGRIHKASNTWLEDICKMNGVVQAPDPAKRKARQFLLKNISVHLAIINAKIVQRFLDTSRLVVQG